MTYLSSIFIAVGRSIITLTIPLIFSFLASQTEDDQAKNGYLAVFCATSVTLCYTVSRQSNSNPEHDWIALKQFFGFSVDYDQSKEISKPIKNTVRARLETTIMICICQSLFFFLIAISKIFTEMNSPDLFDPIRLGSPNHEISIFSLILTSALGAIGIYSHYLIPAFRNPNPWGIFKAPLLKNHEYGHFEVKGPAKVMWFETLSILLSFLERYFILPGMDFIFKSKFI